MTERFDQAAKGWDKSEMRRRLSSNIGKTMLEHVKLEPTMYLMDFGAGTGLLTSHVADKVSKVAAVDLSREMLNELMGKEELAQIVVPYCQNILHDPLQGDFDGIISAMALHHVEDTDEILKVFYGHLKPGGFIALADLDAEDGSFHSHGNEGVFHFGFDREELKSRCEEAGFEEVEFFPAHTVVKEGGREYPIFLMRARRP